MYTSFNEQEVQRIVDRILSICNNEEIDQDEIEQYIREIVDRFRISTNKEEVVPLLINNLKEKKYTQIKKFLISIVGELNTLDAHTYILNLLNFIKL